MLGSDGGEVGSSACNDQDDHYHSVTEGSEEVEERDPPAAQPSVADIKSMKEVPSDSKNVNVEESYYGNKKSNGNNVNDESLSDKNSKYEPNNSIQKDESLSEVSQVGAVDLTVKSSDENVTTSSLEEPKPKEYDGKEHIKDCESPECSENQVLHLLLIVSLWLHSSIFFSRKSF